MEYAILSLCAYIVSPFCRFCQSVNCSERGAVFATISTEMYRRYDLF
jgi:hypothetical protein